MYEVKSRPGAENPEVISPRQEVDEMKARKGPVRTARKAEGDHERMLHRAEGNAKDESTARRPALQSLPLEG